MSNLIFSGKKILITKHLRFYKETLSILDLHKSTQVVQLNNKNRILMLKDDDKCWHKNKKIFTINDLSNGVVACLFDGQTQHLKAVLKAAFPKDRTCPITRKENNYYFKKADNNSEWVTSADLNDKSIEEQSVLIFYCQLLKFKA